LAAKSLDRLHHHTTFSRSVTMSFLCFTTHGILESAFLFLILHEVSISSDRTTMGTFSNVNPLRGCCTLFLFHSALTRYAFLHTLTRVFQFSIKRACDSCRRSVSAAVNSDLCFSTTATAFQQQWVNCRRWIGIIESVDSICRDSADMQYYEGTIITLPLGSQW